MPLGVARLALLACAWASFLFFLSPPCPFSCPAPPAVTVCCDYLLRRSSTRTPTSRRYSFPAPSFAAGLLHKPSPSHVLGDFFWCSPPPPSYGIRDRILLPPPQVALLDYRICFASTPGSWHLRALISRASRRRSVIRRATTRSVATTKKAQTRFPSAPVSLATTRTASSSRDTSN